jgi:DDE domain
MMAQRGVLVSYETIRAWCRTFGPVYAEGLRRRQPRRGDRWHLDEVFLTINGTRQYLWRAVDQDGNVLDILVTSRRDARSAKRFFRKLLKGVRYVPRVVVTDGLRSYGGTTQLWRGLAAGTAQRGPPAVPVSEQPGRELPPAHPAARTRDEEVHLTRARATVLVGVQPDIPTLPAPPPPAHRTGLPTRDGIPFHHLEPGHWTGPGSRLTTAPQSPILPKTAPETLTSKQLDSAARSPPARRTTSTGPKPACC